MEMSETLVENSITFGNYINSNFMGVKSIWNNSAIRSSDNCNTRNSFDSIWIFD